MSRYRLVSTPRTDGWLHRGGMRKNLVKQEANRRANSTRAARTVCAHSSNFPGTRRESKACSRCPFLIAARARNTARMEEESTAVLR